MESLTQGRLEIYRKQREQKKWLELSLIIHMTK